MSTKKSIILRFKAALYDDAFIESYARVIVEAILNANDSMHKALNLLFQIFRSSSVMQVTLSIGGICLVSERSQILGYDFLTNEMIHVIHSMVRQHEDFFNINHGKHGIMMEKYHHMNHINVDALYHKLLTKCVEMIIQSVVGTTYEQPFRYLIHQNYGRILNI